MKNKSPVTAVLGTFDGVHRGHQTLIKKGIETARKKKEDLLAVTFQKPPRLFFHPVVHPYLLTTPIEKSYLLKKFGIKKIRMIGFSKRFSMLTPDTFFKDYLLNRFRAKSVIAGYNFKFGHNREGNSAQLKKLGKQNKIEVQIVAPVKIGGTVVSSGIIRECLWKGNFEKAAHFLGYSYLVIGKVQKGHGIGRTLGFPTANIETDPLKIVPGGVYAVRASVFNPKTLREMGKQYGGMCNVGLRPTIHPRGDGKNLVEVHLFNFSGNLSGKILKVEFVKKLRSERKFKHKEALKKQLIQDRVQALRSLR